MISLIQAEGILARALCDAVMAIEESGGFRVGDGYAVSAAWKGRAALKRACFPDLLALLGPWPYCPRCGSSAVALQAMQMQVCWFCMKSSPTYPVASTARGRVPHDG